MAARERRPQMIRMNDLPELPAAAFAKQDDGDDLAFYEPPRLVTHIDKGAVAKIWRGGCIIRAQFLNRIVDAYENDASIATLLEDEYFAKAIADGEDAWRRIVAKASLSGIPVPGFASALSYYDSLAAERLPASLIQGQRDFFGAHTYKRIDSDKVFHTLWSDDRSEIETEPSTH